MKATLRIKNFAFVFSSQKKANEFLEKLNKIIDEYEEDEGDCFFTYTIDQ